MHTPCEIFFLLECHMLKNFRTYSLAVSFYQECQKLKLNACLRNQLERASSSIALNLAEGNARRTTRDRKHFFQIAYGSLKESEAILDLASANTALKNLADSLGAHLYRLIQNAK